MSNFKNLDKNTVNTRINLFVLILPFFRPDCVLLAGNALNSFFIAWRIVSFLLASYYFSKLYTKRKSFNLGLLFIITYEASIICAALINHVPVPSKIINIANFLGIYFIFYTFAQWNAKELINVTFEILSSFIYINAIATLIFPHGLNHAVSDTGRINFLGLDNTITLYFILACAFCVLYQNVHPNSSKPILTFLIIVLTEVFYKSGSGLVSIALIVAYVVLCGKNKYMRKLTSVNFLMGVYALFEILIVFLNKVQYMGFIFNLLGKSSTFTDRRFYWNHALSQFLLSPVWGQGDGTVDLWNNGYYSHNALLDILLKGGLIAAICWLLLVCFCMRMKKMENNVYIKRFVRILIFTALIYGLMEGLEDRIAFNALLAVAIVMPDIEKQDCLCNALVSTHIKIAK